MGASTLTRLERLDLLAARLKSDDPLTVSQVAGEFGVSRRTLTRDIELLRGRGVPVEADRGRGGGTRVSARWGVGRIALGYREAVDLLVSLAIVEQLRSPILMANLAPIRRKLAASFGPEARARIAKLKSRILVGETASTQVQIGHQEPRSKVVERLHEAFLSTRSASMIYRGETGRVSHRQVQPHYLLLNYPVWYALCWDQTREDVRTFRCDRILDIEIGGDTFAVRPVSSFREALEGVRLVSP
ncbi:MAG TPA: WYL domain-containing protein [Devosia sp.]